MIRKLPLALLVAAVLLAVPTLIARWGGESQPADEGESRPLASTATVGGRRPAAELITFWADKSAAAPQDHISRSHLAEAHLRSARETGDLSAIANAEAALDEALTLNPLYAPALILDAAVRYSQHDFAGALEQAERVYDDDPRYLPALATIGDANLELGRYDEAAAAYETLVAEERSAPVLSRLARLAWIEGRTADALALAAEARDDAVALGLQGPDLAFHHAVLATYLLETGDATGSAAAATEAIAEAPGYPVAHFRLGLARAALGRLDQAAEALEQAAEIVPEPVTLAALGDVYAALGDQAAAEQQYATVEAIAQLGADEAQVYDRQLALFRADHGRDLDAAVALAEAEIEIREDVFGYDTLAWTLLQVGRVDEAVAAANSALALGTQEPRLLYRAGMVHFAAGNNGEARRLLRAALDINEAFDVLHAPIAAETLAELESVR